jgi:hypothetical protein
MFSAELMKDLSLFMEAASASPGQVMDEARFQRFG